MPTYEMPLIIRVMKKPEIAAVLKRTANLIFQTGGFIRDIENWGMKHLPCKISAHGQVHTEANHFFMRFDIPPKEITKILDETYRDMDIVRIKIFKQCFNNLKKRECSFHEEMLPPPYRPDVQELLKKASRLNRKREFKYNSGLNYYPFTK